MAVSTTEAGTPSALGAVGVVLAQMTTDFGGDALPSEAGFRTGLLIGAGIALLAALIAMAIPTKASQEAEDRLEHDVAVAG